MYLKCIKKEEHETNHYCSFFFEITEHKLLRPPYSLVRKKDQWKNLMKRQQESFIAWITSFLIFNRYSHIKYRRRTIKFIVHSNIFHNIN